MDVMDGPWSDYAAAAAAPDGPWSDYVAPATDSHVGVDPAPLSEPAGTAARGRFGVVERNRAALGEGPEAAPRGIGARAVPIDGDASRYAGPPSVIGSGARGEGDRLTAYEPTWRDRLARALIGGTRPSPEKRRFVEGLLGSSGLGTTGASISDLTPAGIALNAQEAGQKIQSGDFAGAVGPLIGVAGWAKPVQQAAQASVRNALSIPIGFQLAPRVGGAMEIVAPRGVTESGAGPDVARPTGAQEQSPPASALRAGDQGLRVESTRHEEGHLQDFLNQQRSRRGDDSRTNEELRESSAQPLGAASGDSGNGVVRIVGEALDKARDSLHDMFEAVRRGPPKDMQRIDLGPITPEGAARVNGLLRDGGVQADVSGFRHEVDVYAARHSFTKHGNPAVEEPRGQVALTADDWATIPDILSAPDHMAYLGRTDVGRDTIGYWRRVNGHILYLEEVRTGRKTLAAVAMRKFKDGGYEAPGRPDGPKAPQSYVQNALPGDQSVAPKTSVRNAPLDDDNLTVDGLSINVSPSRAGFAAAMNAIANAWVPPASEPDRHTQTDSPRPAAQAFQQSQSRRSPADAREREAEVLRRFGYSDDDIAAMTPEQRAAQAARAVESGISTARDDDSGSGGEPPKPLAPDATDSSDKRRSEIEGLIREVHGEAHPDDVALAGMLMHRHGLDAHDAFEHATLVNALRAGDISPGQMASVIGKDKTDALRQAALFVGELRPAEPAGAA